jgi:hypothetical protein
VVLKNTVNFEISEASMPITNETSELVGREVERLFKEHPPVRDQLCRNPVTEGEYVGFDDPVEEQMEIARRALYARKWHAESGPPDLQPLPISARELDAAHLRETLLHYILAKFARSMNRNHLHPDRKFEGIEHPIFAEYAAGVLWEEELPVGGFAGLPDYGAEQLLELKKRFPPRMLKGMSPGLTWLPPDEHREAIASVRRGSHNAEVYFNRE